MLVRRGLARRLATQYAVKVLHEDIDLGHYLVDEGLSVDERREVYQQLRQIISDLRARLAPEHQEV